MSLRGGPAGLCPFSLLRAAEKMRSVYLGPCLAIYEQESPCYIGRQSVNCDHLPLGHIPAQLTALPSSEIPLPRSGGAIPPYPPAPFS